MKPELVKAEASHKANLAFTETNCAQFPRGKAYTDAIRRKCLDCCCGNAALVADCHIENCALWPYRFGSSPFKQRSPSRPPS